MICVPLFCKIPPHWWRLLLPLFSSFVDLRTPLFKEPVLCSETKLSWRRPKDARPLQSTCNPPTVTRLVTLRNTTAIIQRPAGFLLQDKYNNKQHTRSQASGDAETFNTSKHKAHNAAEQRQSQTASAHYNDNHPVEYNHHIPNQTTF